LKRFFVRGEDEEQGSEENASVPETNGTNGVDEFGDIY